MAVHKDLGVIAIILLIGIVKKNGIMLVDFALEEQRGHALSPRDAIYQACTLRFRPILMTTTASLLGGVPLMVGTGTGSELRQPLGYTIVGGLMLSQILTLYTTPGRLPVPRQTSSVPHRTQAAGPARSQRTRGRGRKEAKS